MKVPRELRKQVDAYVRAGFNPVDITHREGSHYRVVFAEFPENPQFITKNAGDPRALKNNIARFRRLASNEGANK